MWVWLVPCTTTLMRRLFFVVVALSAALACSSSDSAEDWGEANYTTTGLCDGLPRVNLETPPGVCVGVVLSGPRVMPIPGTDLRFPRGLAELPNGDLILADMGGFAT